MGRDIAEDSSLINENDDEKIVEVVSPRGEKDGIVKKLKSHTENGFIGLINNGGHRGNGFGAIHGGRSSHESESDEHGLLGNVILEPKKKIKEKKKKQKLRKKNKKKRKKYPNNISVVHEYYAENSQKPSSEHQNELSNYDSWHDTNDNQYNLVNLVDLLPDPPNISKPKKMKMKKKGKPGKQKYGRDIGGSVGGLQYSITVS